MSQFKFSADLFLEKIELDKFQSFVSEGYRQHIVQSTKTYGFFDLVQAEVQTNSAGQKVINISGLQAIDTQGNYISSIPVKVLPFSNGQWYWLKVKHAYTSIEKGYVSIDTSGNLTSSNIPLTSLLRGQPNFPSRISFPLSSLNTSEYDVIEVVNDSLCILQGNFQAETNTRIAVVGTFTPGKTVPQISKYPFEYDSAEFEWVQESSLNSPPIKGNDEYWLFRVKSNGSNVFVQNKQSEFFTTIDNGVHIPATDTVGIDFIRYNPINTVCESNQVAVSWGIRCSAWTVGQYNKIFLQAAEGGLIKTISQLDTDDLIGFRVYTTDGRFCTVESCIKNGSVIELTVDSLNYKSFSVDGGETFISQQLIIVPANDLIEITFLEDTKNDSNETQKYTFPCSAGQGICNVLLTKWPKTQYRVTYQFRKNTANYKFPQVSSPSRFIDTDDIGYLNELSFNLDGTPKSVLQRTPFVSDVLRGYIVLTGFSHSYLQIKQNVLKNNIGIEYIAYKNTQQVYKITPSINKTHQVIFGPSALGSTYQELYIVLSTELVLEGSYFVIQLHSNVLVGDKVINIVTGFIDITEPGTILKTLNKRDFSEALNVSGDGVSIECVFDGANWHLSQKYINQPKGEIVMFDGTVEDFENCFDGSGLGKANGWKGYAICNGANGTPNLINKFVYGVGDASELRKTGGSSEVKLSINNLPSHFHEYVIQSAKVGKNAGSGEDALWRTLDFDTNNITVDINRGKTGSVGRKDDNLTPISTMPPFTCLAYVKRIY